MSWASESTDSTQPIDTARRGPPTAPAGPLDAQVEPVGRSVHLECRARARGRGVDGVPVEIEVVASPDHPARRMRDDVHVRAADPIERASGQLGPWLATRYVDRCDDDVEPGQEVVLDFELGIGPDLELAAVQKTKALRWSLRRSRTRFLLGCIALVERGDDLGLLGDAVGCEPAG